MHAILYNIIHISCFYWPIYGIKKAPLKVELLLESIILFVFLIVVPNGFDRFISYWYCLVLSLFIIII